jgi:tRNA(Ile)-lysidine synthase
MTELSIANIVRAAIKRHNVFNKTIIVGASGGIDSQVLLHTFGFLAKDFNLKLIAVGVNHGLRPEAGEELILAKNLAESLDIKFITNNIQVEHGSNLEARARDARYVELRNVFAEYNADYISTAHHKQDKAETVMIRMLRNAPFQALAVLPELKGDLFRPLIESSKDNIINHARKFRIDFAYDKSNDDLRFLRNEVRHDILPRLRKINPNIDETLIGYAKQAEEL